MNPHFLSCYPHIAIHIFKHLDFESLENCVQVCTAWSELLTNEKFYWLNMTKGEHGDWARIFPTMDSKTFCTLGKAFKKLKECKDDFGRQREWEIHPMSCAVYLDDMEIFEALLNYYEDIQSLFGGRYDYERNLLHLASEEGSIKVLERILDEVRSFHLVQADRFFRTPMHLAAKSGHLQVVILLYKHLDIYPNRYLDQKDYRGETCYEIAIRNGHSEVADYIHEAYKKGKSPIYKDCVCGRAHNKRSREFFDRAAKKAKVCMHVTLDK